MTFALLTTQDMARADQAAVAAGVDSLTLMEAAGVAVADAARSALAAKAKLQPSVAVLCGPGNNGGDGFVAARHLRAAGIPVRLALLCPETALKGDAAAMRARWKEPVLPITPEIVQGAGLVIDALFGAGLSRPLEGAAAEAVALIEAARKAGAFILAVDVPSGLDGSTGEAPGPVVTATETVTFFRLKPGHLLMPGRRLCGTVRLAPIPIPEAVLDAIAPRTFENLTDLWLPLLPSPGTDAHKYTRGHALVVSGPPDATGAARLGARACLRVGAGLVTVVGNSAATAVNALHLTAIMVALAPDAAALGSLLEDRRRNAVLIGPGASVGPATAEAVLAVLESSAAAVLDADALTSFVATDTARASEASGFGFMARRAHETAGPDALFDAIGQRTAPVVLTPHEGEFKRLFAIATGDKLSRAREAARRSGAIVILKGADTVIAAPDGRAAINSNAPPWLATAGSGDVLAGLVTGLLAQGMPAFESACAAVWMHGDAAARFGRGLIAEDLPDMIPRVLQALPLP
jgi:hydroxyethylthiazole kinase-like uncharacterized protein yjeF